MKQYNNETPRRLGSLCYGATVALTALAALVMTGCTDGNDWDVDSSYNRTFAPTGDITIERFDTKVAVSFKSVKGASKYEVELNTDSLYQDETQASSIIQEFTTAADTVRGLKGETNYYLRVRAIVEGKPSSKWLYYKTGSGRQYFTTLAEQLFYELTAADIEDGVLHLSWIPGSEVTSIVVLANGEQTAEYALSADQKAAGRYDVVGLAPTTTYTLQLMNGDVKRGSLNVTTPASMPAADYKYTLANDVTVISQDLINEIAELAKAAADNETNYSVTIGIPASTTLDMHGTSEAGDKTSIKLPDGMSVTFFGLSGGDAPVLSVSKSLDIRGSHAFVRFENVVIKDGGCQYFINQSEGCTLGELGFNSVTLQNMERSWVRLQGSAAKSIEQIVVDNCLVENQGKGSYALFYFNDAAYTIGRLKVTNSTFNTLLHSFVDCRKSKTGAIDVSNSTFYNIIGAGRYFVDGQDTTVPITLSGVIFAKTGSDTSKGIRESQFNEPSNCYFTSDFVLSSNKFTVDQAFEGTANDLFRDAANGDFTLKVNSIKAGDPRWLPEE